MQPIPGQWGWMYWNLALAVVPAVLAGILFRRRSRITVSWWIGVAAFVAVLPNAPYVLTDVVHMQWDFARAHPSEVFIRYTVLFGVGMLAFVFAMWRCSRFMFLHSIRLRYIALVDLAACAICALGVYIGRVHRFNSWDVVRAPHAVMRAAYDGLTSHLALAGMGLVFAVIALAALIGIVVLESIAAVLRRPSP